MIINYNKFNRIRDNLTVSDIITYTMHVLNNALKEEEYQCNVYSTLTKIETFYDEYCITYSKDYKEYLSSYNKHVTTYLQTPDSFDAVVDMIDLIVNNCDIKNIVIYDVNHPVVFILMYVIDKLIEYGVDLHEVLNGISVVCNTENSLYLLSAILPANVRVYMKGQVPEYDVNTTLYYYGRFIRSEDDIVPNENDVPYRICVFYDASNGYRVHMRFVSWTDSDLHDDIYKFANDVLGDYYVKAQRYMVKHGENMDYLHTIIEEMSMNEEGKCYWYD